MGGDGATSGTVFWLSHLGFCVTGLPMVLLLQQEAYDGGNQPKAFFGALATYGGLLLGGLLAIVSGAVMRGQPKTKNAMRTRGVQGGAVASNGWRDLYDKPVFGNGACFMAILPIAVADIGDKVLLAVLLLLVVLLVVVLVVVLLLVVLLLVSLLLVLLLVLLLLLPLMPLPLPLPLPPPFPQWFMAFAIKYAGAQLYIVFFSSLTVFTALIRRFGLGRKLLTVQVRTMVLVLLVLLLLLAMVLTPCLRLPQWVAIVVINLGLASVALNATDSGPKKNNVALIQGIGAAFACAFTDALFYVFTERARSVLPPEQRPSEVKMLLVLLVLVLLVLVLLVLVLLVLVLLVLTRLSCSCRTTSARCTASSA